MTLARKELKLLVVLIVAAASASILSTARTFSATADEPAHIAAGMQWLTTNRYDYDLQHPPLGRIAVALGPYLEGSRGIHAPATYDEGAAILGTGKHYVDTLARARHGAIVFFLMLAVATWAWARRLGGDLVAITATLFLVCNPNILAHAGLATTDIACAAMTTVALFVATWWIEQPDALRSMVFGAAIGAAISSRLSAIAFLGGAMVVCYLMRGFATRSWWIDRQHSLAKSLGAIAVIAISMSFVISAAYAFHVSPFIHGVEKFLVHGSSGHPTFLLGRPSNKGWWYYFPVALLVKTPIPLLIATLLGGAAVINGLRERRDWLGAVPLVSASVILAISLTVKVDLGVRLVLPAFPLMAIAAAQGLAYFIRTNGSRIGAPIVAALLLWTVLTPIRSYPDHLSYFNVLAGDHPERVLVDSNLDWGQDLYRLRDTLVARGITDSVRIAYFGTTDVSAAGVPRARPLGLHEHATGWIAASETYLAGEWVGGAYAWLLDYPSIARIGPSMRLWYIAPDSTSVGQTHP